MRREPLVSIGLPVSNGENYVAEAISSILSQTYSNLELIVCDNASTDATGDIALDFARRDGRVRYYRNQINVGALPNHRRALALATGSYFRWHGHDDVLMPDFLKQCVDVLESDPGIVLCHSRTGVIRGDGSYKSEYPFRLPPPDASPAERFRSLLADPGSVILIYGLMRQSAVSGIRPMGDWVGSDWVVLAELLFRGRFAQVPEVLFHRRHHEKRSVKQFSKYDRVAYLDTSKSGRISFPTWRRHWEYGSAIAGSPMCTAGKAACFRHLARAVVSAPVRRQLWRDIRASGRRLLLPRGPAAPAKAGLSRQDASAS